MKLIETPYGRKTPELLCKAMDSYVMLPALIELMTYSLRCLDEDSFPSLREDLRNAITKAEKLCD